MKIKEVAFQDLGYPFPRKYEDGTRGGTLMDYGQSADSLM